MWMEEPQDYVFGLLKGRDIMQKLKIEYEMVLPLTLILVDEIADWCTLFLNRVPAVFIENGEYHLWLSAAEAAKFKFIWL